MDLGRRSTLAVADSDAIVSTFCGVRIHMKSHNLAGRIM